MRSGFASWFRGVWLARETDQSCFAHVLAPGSARTDVDVYVTEFTRHL